MIEDYRVVSARIRQELKELERVTFRADRAIAAAKRQPGDQDLYIDSAALSLHDFYSGLERIFHESFYKNISAFANTKGGIIILGADNKGNIKGIDPSSKFLEDLTNRTVNKLSIYPDISAIDMKGKRAIVVNIARSSYPVSYEGRYFERIGNTTREMNHEKLRLWFVRGKPWDCLTGNFSKKEIDAETVSRFILNAVENKRLVDTSLNEPPQLVLRKLGFIENDKLTNGAILLYCKND